MKGMTIQTVRTVYGEKEVELAENTAQSMHIMESLY